MKGFFAFFKFMYFIIQLIREQRLIHKGMEKKTIENKRIQDEKVDIANAARDDVIGMSDDKYKRD